MGRKSREKHNIKIRPPVAYTPIPKKKGISNTKKIFASLTLIAIIVIAASVVFSSQSPQANQLSTQGSYPQNVAPVSYSLPVISSDNNQVTIPSSTVNSSKLVFVDLKLTNPKETLEYQGRTVPLVLYRNGEYLPLVIISTPSGNTVAGIRTCEPCGSFSFHIVSGANLKCDVCGAEWTLETFAPVSGGCATYPPPKLTANVNGENTVIDLSPLQLQYTAQ